MTNCGWTVEPCDPEWGGGGVCVVKHYCCEDGFVLTIPDDFTSIINDLTSLEQLINQTEAGQITTVPFIAVTTLEPAYLGPHVALTASVDLGAKTFKLNAPMRVLRTEQHDRFSTATVIPTTKGVAEMRSFLNGLQQAIMKEGSNRHIKLTHYELRHQLLAKSKETLPAGDYFESFTAGILPFTKVTDHLGYDWVSLPAQPKK